MSFLDVIEAPINAGKSLAEKIPGLNLFIHGTEALDDILTTPYLLYGGLLLGGFIAYKVLVK